jgi:hypothetical protein
MRRPVEASCRRRAAEQDRWTGCYTHLLGRSYSLADVVGDEQRSACFYEGSRTRVTYSIADVVRLTATLQPLGLQSLRAARLVELSRLYLSDPPDPACPRPSRNYPHPTPVSHLPGCGPYALDSYRIFCGKPDEWKEIRPSDKELIRYLVRTSITILAACS